MKKALKRQRTVVSRLARDVRRKAGMLAECAKSKLAMTLEKVERIVEQSKQRKRVGGHPQVVQFPCARGGMHLERGKVASPTSLV